MLERVLPILVSTAESKTEPCCNTVIILTIQIPSRFQNKPIMRVTSIHGFIYFLLSSHAWYLFDLLACLIMNGNKENRKIDTNEKRITEKEILL